MDARGRIAGCVSRGTVIALLVVSGTGFAEAATQTVLGARFVVKDPSTTDPSRRRVVAAAREAGSAALAGDPVASGATLMVVANGGTSSAQTLSLPASGWSATRTGFRYRDATGTAGPTRSATIKRSTAGTLSLKVVLSGRAGPVDVVPPNPGSDGGVSLGLLGGDTYCVAFGGAAGGTVQNVGASLFQVRRPMSTPGCPVPPTTSTTSSSTSTTSTSTTSSTTTTGPPVCGNDVIDAGETCDGTAPSLCNDFGFACAAPGGACPACDCCVGPGGTGLTGPGGVTCCCDGQACEPTGPGTCRCPSPADCAFQPFPTCGGVCFAGGECRPIRVVGGSDLCTCVTAAPCDAACGGGGCPSGLVCAYDPGNCSCVAP